MNAEILKRVVRAISEGSREDLERLAEIIVEAERQVGHTKLAEQLSSILKRPRPRMSRGQKDEVESRSLAELPTGKRYGQNLATLIPREYLEHHMVLPKTVDDRFARIEREFAARERLGAYGLKPRKTILLYGPPGCGKTLGAKRLAWNVGLPLMKVRFDALISSFFGESAMNLRSVFDAAKERPCVLLLDECDFIAKSRTNSKDIGEASRIVNSLLTLM
ncbi:MAG: AAA family ATPase, partial [Aureliella sp.]